jgi:hypothetical protein
MRQLLATAALALAFPAQADEPTWVCRPYPELRAELGTQRQKVLWSGLTEMGHELVLLVSDRRTFTVLERQPSGDACVIHRGRGSKLAPSFLVAAAAQRIVTPTN